VSTLPRPGQQISFRATLENWAGGMDYCAVPVPAEVTAALGTHGPVLVMARVDESAPFQVSLFPVGGGKHYIRIRAAVRKEVGVMTGDEILIRATVLDRAEVEMPDDLVDALKAENASDAFALLPPGKRNFLVRRINEVARAETRAKRIAEAVEAAHERRDKLAGRG
jgi:hypothetical protein